MESAKDTLAGGLPHSEIPGSTIARISPGLFAACHVLHRLSVPRHTPDALPSQLTPPLPIGPSSRPAPGTAAETAAHRGKTQWGQTRMRDPRMKTLLRTRAS